MNRSEYVKNCKRRAIATLDSGGKPMDACVQMICEMNKREDCKLDPMLSIALLIGEIDNEKARSIIEGFN